jgi:hypothetical protein
VIGESPSHAGAKITPGISYTALRAFLINTDRANAVARKDRPWGAALIVKADRVECIAVVAIPRTAIV